MPILIRDTIPEVIVAPNPKTSVSILPVDDTVPFVPTAKGVWRFNKKLEDEVGQADFSPSTGSALYKQFDKFELLKNETQNRSGLQFELSKKYSATPSFSYPSDFTVSFWYFSPGLVGFTRHFITRELEPKVAPIFAKSDGTKTATTTDLTSSTFVITEIGSSKTKNAIRVYITENGADISHIITSEEFEPGLHHVLITYIRNQGRLRVDIDGKLGILHSAPTTSLDRPGLLNINDIVPGFLSHRTEQEGAYIFDLVFTTYASLDNESLKAFRYGYEHITFDNLFDTRFSYFGLSYAQPTTISTTHVFVDGGNIFAARSNGKIMRGDRPIWDKEFAYPDVKSVRTLILSETGDEKIVEWTPSGLRVKGVSVRI